MIGEPTQAVTGENFVAHIHYRADDGECRPCGGVVVAQDGECLADGFGAGVDDAVGGSGMHRGSELNGINACQFKARIARADVDTFDEGAVGIEFGEEIRRFDACVAPAVVVDERGIDFRLTHMRL